MKALLRNDIFTNPEGWAKKAVGTPWSYRIIQAVTVFASIALFVMFTLISRPLPFAQHLGIGISIAAFTLVFPLCYLRALRCLYLKNRREESDQPEATSRKMINDKNAQQNRTRKIIHLGTFDFAGKGPGTYSGGVVKLYGKQKEDLLDSAESFLKAADRCLNGCKIEEGVEMLTVPGTVCASFSCELFLKYILLKENGKVATGHKLLDLFKKCSTEVQTSLTERKSDIIDILERNSKQFVEARYHHENNGFSFRQQELLQTAELLSRFVKEKYADKDA